MRVAVTGAGGRLGRAMVEALADAPFTGPAGPVAWTRREFDLDEVASIDALLDRDRPEVVVHAAAWTDVDGCARDPGRAMARNGDATDRLAAACASRGVDLVVISTNEVFDGRRDDGRGYRADDVPSPANAYGASKLAGESAATARYEARWAAGRGAEVRPPQLAVARTSWLFGPGAPDFPTKILAAADRAREAGEALRVVSDEWGSPTYTHDLAEAIVELLAEDALAPRDRAVAIHHLVGGGVASRADWARQILQLVGRDVAIEEVPSSTWPRASTPPRWAVLEPTPLPSGEPMRPWPAAMADHAPSLRRGVRGSVADGARR
ncbi:MAG TPA: SDR family oxidoreductase [Candidatus Saccharimonadales bacterium]|nr:SDR family oxidoreductase [Candidatus Saccharimonadales bacterium]